MHQNKDYLRWEKTVRELLPCTPIPKHTHRRHFHRGHAEEESTEEKKGSTDEIASLLGLRQLQISVNLCYSKPA